MTKRKVIRESNRLFTYNPNYYNWGGDFKEALKGLGPFDLKSTFSGTNVANMLKGGLASGLGSTLGNIGGNLISGGLESSAGSAFSNIGGTVGKAISAVNPVLGGLMSAGSGIIGGGINAVLGSKLNKEKINEIEGSNKGMNTLIVDNSNTDTIENQWANQNFGVDFTQSDIGKDGLLSNKAKNTYNRLKQQQTAARNRAFASYENAINSADFNQDLNLLQNYAAYGGLLDMNNQYSDGGKIYIKPENRGKFTALKERTGKSATWFKEHGTPAQKKMATFALNSRKWKHEDGGPLFIESLPEITVTPTNDAKFLFSQGIYKRTSRPPLGDKNIRKLVAGYLSKYDNENAEEYNKRISRLADAIYEPGIQFKTNKKDRAYYSPSTGIAYIKTMDDFFGELAHPYQEARGTFKPIHELSEENYDNDKDYRGGTRYAYPDTFEGETHGFFEPALNEWITTGKIGKSSPVINKRQSNEKITPKDIEEVTDSAASWSKQAAIKRIISKPNQLPFLERIKYKLIDFPLRDSSRNIIYPKKEQKEYAFGGELTHGGIFNNGINIIDNGGTHEENPYEGVQMGVDNQGIPNLVEEGEVVFNDYVFSNRLNVPKDVKNKYKLRGNKELTFADAAKQMQKESEERPNDPISKKGLTSSMSILQQAQEDVRQKKQQNKENRSNKFKKGGNLVPTDILNDPRWKTVPKLPDNFNSDPFVGLRPFLNAKTSESTMLTDELNKGIASYKKDLQSYFSRNNKNDDIATSWLRYAPAFGSALGVGYNLLSKPDYSRADALAQFAQNAGKVTPISYEPIGNYLTYRPTDLSYQANRMAAQAGATRRNIMNTSGGNRANAIGSLLAADYNNQIAMGEAIRKAEATNFARRAQVEEFNRGTNQYNSEAALKAAIANQQARLDASRLGLSGYTTAMQMKDAIDAQRARTLSANLTNLFESLGQIGEEQYDENRLKWLERKGVLRSDYFDTGKYRRD